MKGMHIGLLSMAVMLTLIAGVFLSAEQITQAHLGLLMLALIVVAIMLGFPTAFTLMGLGMIFGYMAFYVPGQSFWQNSIFDLMVQRTYGVMTNDVLIAVPLFVFMGYIVERASIVDRLFHSIQLAMRNVPASLAVATIITCALFATATGIIGAVVTLMGLLALRPMLKAGYDVKLAAGSITAGGCLGILIPPSILLILYGATAGVSVVRLDAGAQGVTDVVRAVDGADYAGAGFDHLWSGDADRSRGPGFARRHCACRRLSSTDLGAAQGVGISHRAHHGDGLLAVRGLGAVLRHLRVARRPAAYRELGVVTQPVAPGVHVAVAGHHLPARLAA